ncbi:Phospholipid scramblase 1 [Bienertia sinuspersici]
MERKALGSEESTERISKEEIARKTWRNIRLQGHTYVDLRKDGKRSVYFVFCVWRVVIVNLSAWSFGRNVDVKEKDIASGNRTNLLDDYEHVDNLAVIVHNDVPNSGGDQSHFNEEVAVDELIIPNVIGPVEVSDLRVKLMGYGKISANLLEKDGANTDMQSIWCEWLGKMGGEIDDIDSDLPTHELLSSLLSTSMTWENRRKISCSDSEDASRALSHVSYSSGEDPQCSRTNTTKRLRKEQHIASKKTCFICKRTIISGKDVATLLNLKTGRLVCSSRNLKGAFHVFHTSCLIHWILLCESEMFLKPPVHPKVIGKSKKAKSKVNQPRRKVRKAIYLQCSAQTAAALVCKLKERNWNNQPLLFHRVAVSHRAWMDCPEKLKNCSTGFAFPVQVDNAEKKIQCLKLLKFYRADDRR